MRSYKLTSFGQPLVPADDSPPTLSGAEVLVEVEACGVCHSDLHLWDGYWDLGDGKKIVAADGGKLLPLTMGHEIVGTVTAAGPDAKVEVGARRAIFPWIGCHECPTCKAGEEHLCQGRNQAIGIFTDGGYATHVRVPHPQYLLDIDGIEPQLACTYACSGLTAYSALKKVGRLGRDERLLILGAGGVGLSAIRMAEAVTGRRPIVAEIDPAKRDAALQAGATEAIDPAADGAQRVLFKATGGVSAAIDFAGAPASFNFGQASLRKGGKLVLVGLLGGAVSVSLPLITMRAIAIQGSYVGSLAEMRELLALAKAGKVPAIPIATRPLDQVNHALADLKAGKVVGRVVLQP